MPQPIQELFRDLEHLKQQVINIHSELISLFQEHLRILSIRHEELQNDASPTTGVALMVVTRRIQETQVSLRISLSQIHVMSVILGFLTSHRILTLCSFHELDMYGHGEEAGVVLQWQGGNIW